MKKLKKPTFIRNNPDGFAMVFLVLILPTVTLLLGIIYQLIILTEFRSEFRYLCLTESLKLQKELFTTQSNAKADATILLEKLKKIITIAEFKVGLAEYPDYEPEAPIKPEYRLVYRLNYSSADRLFKFNLSCGIRLHKKDEQWHYENIYSADAGKF